MSAHDIQRLTKAATFAYIVLVAACMLGCTQAGGSGVAASTPGDATQQDPAPATAEDAASAEIMSGDGIGPPAISTPDVSSTRAAAEEAIQGYEDHVCVSFALVDGGDAAGFSIAGDRLVPSASMIKTAVLATFLQQTVDGRISLDESYTIKRSDIVGGTGTIQNMGAGTMLNLDQLADLMISQSDNVATNVLIDRLGMDTVNEECSALGLRGTTLRRKMMDQAAAAEGRENYTCADDQAELLLAVAEGRLVNAEASERALGYLESQTDSRGLVDGIPTGVVVAHKTGTLASVRHDGGIVFGERPYVLVVMTEGLDEPSANALIARISQAVWAAAEA